MFLPRRKILKFRLALFLSIIAVVAGVFVLLSFVADIRHISCTYDDGASCPDVVWAEFSRHLGKSLFSVKLVETKEKVLRALPEISEVVVEKKFPSSINIVLKNQSSSYSLVSSGGEVFFVSNDGVLLKHDGSKDTVNILLRDSETFRVGDSIGKEKAQQFEGIAKFVSMVPQVHKVEMVNDTEIQMMLEGETRAVLKLEGIEDQLSTLQVILRDSTMGIQGKTIDLRFAHPVIQ